LDFISTPISVTFGNFDTEAPFSVRIINDSLIEPNETFTLELSNGNTATVTIVDNDVLVRPEFTSYNMREGNTVQLRLIRSGYNISRQTIVTVSPISLSATAGSDFASLPRTVRFASGSTSAWVYIGIYDDTVVESTERFIAILSTSEPNVALGANIIVNILDNDVLVRPQSTAYTVGEGDGTVTLTLVRSGYTSTRTTVTVTPTSGSAIGGSDFISSPITVTFQRYITSVRVSVRIIDDSTVESTETFTAVLTTSESNVEIHDGRITVSIIDNDVLVRPQSTAYTVGEGDGTVTLTLVRSGYTSTRTTVTVTPTSGSATGGSDFPLSPINVRFRRGRTVARVQVPITDDSIVENTETFTAVLTTSESNVEIRGSFTINIRDNDALILFSPATYNVDEDDGSVTLRLLRRGDLSNESVVHVTPTSTVSANSTNGVDFNSSIINVTFIPGQVEATFQVPIIDDFIAEDTEIFIAILSTNATNIKFGDDVATVTIKDNDRNTLLPGQLPCDHVLRRLTAFAHLFTHCNCVHNPEWTEWVAISHTHQLISQCPTGGALIYQQRQRRISGDCIDNMEHKTKCDPVVIDQIIKALGLGSSGQRYGDLPSNTNQTSGSRYRRGGIADVTGCPAPPSISPPRKVCLEYTVPHNQVGRRSVQESHIDDNVSPFQTKSSSVPFSSTAEDLLRRKRTSTRNCHYKHVLFVIDVSGSIGGPNFNKVTSVLAELVPVLCDQTKVAVMTFDHEYFIEFCFNKYADNLCGRAHAGNAICSIPYVHGTGTRYTHTSGAIQCICNNILSNCGMEDGCQEVRVVFFTDGLANGPGGPTRVCDEMDCLRCEDGNETYAIGIGDPRNIECMRNTPNMDRPWSFPNFEEFESNFRILQDMLIQGNFPCVSP
jgi:hypothetical protein